MTAVTPEVHRVNDIAARLDVHRTTVYRAIKAGELTAIRVGHGRGALRITAEALAAWLSDCQRAAIHAPAQPARH